MTPFKRRNLTKHLGLSGFLSALIFSTFHIHWVFSIILGVNIWLFLLFGSDKFRSTKDMRRTPETTFLTMAFFGGFPALFMGRFIFKHKTIKKEFIGPMWGLFILQVGALIYFFFM